MLNDDITTIWSPLTVCLCFCISHFSDVTYSLTKILHRQKASRGHRVVVGGWGWTTGSWSISEAGRLPSLSPDVQVVQEAASQID